MVPHGGGLMISAPTNPMQQVRKSTGKSVRNPKKEIKDFTNVLFA